MKCLAYLPTQDGQATKAGLEAVSYAMKCGADVVALAVGSLNSDGGAGSAGASKVLHVSQDLQDEAQIARAVSEAAKAEGCILYTSDAADD